MLDDGRTFAKMQRVSTSSAESKEELPGENRRLCLLLFLFLWVSFAWFYHTGEHNENAHFDQIRALAENGSWQIDRFSGNTADVIKLGGHVFPNKAPGVTYLGVLPWKLFRAVLSTTPLSGAAQLHFTAYLVSLTTLGLCSALTGCAVFRLLLRFGLSQVVALCFALLYALGTIAFPFSTVLFSHQLAASFLFLGFFLLCERKQPWQVVAAGFLLGFAPVLEYPAALGTVIIGLYGLTRLRGRWFLLFLGSGIAAGTFLLFYNWTAFHQLLFVSYEAYKKPGSVFAGHSRGFAGVSWPQANILWEITFGRQRGLFYVNPWLVLILPALFTLRERFWRRELIVCFAMVGVFFSFNSGFGDSIVYWGGAWSIGPRHLVPMLPFMTVPIALLCRERWFAVAAAVLGSVSLLAMFSATAITPRVPYEASDPFLFYLRQLHLGRISLNAAGIFANRFVPGYSFNLGQLLGLPGRTQLLPLALLWAIAIPWLFRKAWPLVTSRAARMTPFYFSGAIVSLSLVPVLWHVNQPVPQGWTRGLAGVITPGLFLQNASSADADATFLDTSRVVHRRDAPIDLAWPSESSPFPAPFGGIWTGVLCVPVAGLYSFALESDDGSALYLDGRPVIDHWRSGGAARKDVAVILSRGFYPIALHYENSLNSGILRLFWSPPDVAEEIVPPEYLFSRP